MPYTGRADVDRMFCVKDADEGTWDERPPRPEPGFGLFAADTAMVYMYTGMSLGTTAAAGRNPRVRRGLDRVLAGKGPTALDWLVDISNSATTN